MRTYLITVNRGVVARKELERTFFIVLHDLHLRRPRDDCIDCVRNRSDDNVSVCSYGIDFVCDSSRVRYSHKTHEIKNKSTRRENTK